MIVPSSGKVPNPAYLEPGPLVLLVPLQSSEAVPGLGERATRRPHLDRPGGSQSNWAGRLSRSPRSSERWSLTELRQAPPLPGHWPQSLGAWPSRGWGRLRWPPALLSASLLWLRARRPGWLGCARVPAPAPAPTMGNSHHKRKAPSGPRARSFWRFGRSAKRPAGRGWGWGRGRRGGGSACRSCRRRCCPLPGLVGCEFGGAGNPPHRPHPSHADRHMYARILAGGHTYMFTIYTVTYTTPTETYGHADTKSHTGSHPHHRGTHRS